MKKILVSFSAIVSLLLLVMTISAATTEIAIVESLEIKGIDGLGSEDISVIAGEIIPVLIIFEALEDASDVSIEAELDGEKVDFDIEVFVGDIEAGKRYSKLFNLEVPYGLQDEVSDDLTLDIKIENSDFKTQLDEVILRVQRPAYNTQVMLISTKSSINAGETFPVDVVLKNVGYNDLDDLYVTASIPALNIERVVYLGDLIAVECDDDFNDLKNYGVAGLDRKCNEDDEDTVRGRIFLEVPHNVESGVYTLEIEARNSDVIINKAKQIVIRNGVPETVIKSGNSLIVVNPTNALKVYSIVPESPATVSASVLVVPAGSSRQVTVNANSAESFSVSVLSGNEVVGTAQFSGVSEDSSTTTGVVVLTVILAIIFLVLLIVLVVLLTKKPDKDEDLGESYY